jgi:membrane protease YdiL (CAAX protease family)
MVAECSDVEYVTLARAEIERLASDLAIGVALGAAFFSVVMAVLLATGAYTLTGPTAAAAWLPLADSLEGTVEELIFRGSVFRLLSGVLGIWWALGLSSASFGAWHLVKPGAEMMAVLGVICAGGIPLAGALHADGPSVGLHRVPRRLELHRGLCVRSGRFGQRPWPEPLSRPTGSRR